MSFAKKYPPRYYTPKSNPAAMRVTGRDHRFKSPATIMQNVIAGDNSPDFVSDITPEFISLGIRPYFDLHSARVR
jgi:hypothetical protein